MEKIVLVTGANSGIGKAAALQMAALGWKVVIACRNEERGKKALAEIRTAGCALEPELLVMDLSLKSSIRSAVAEFKARHDRLDALIHNAAEFDISRKRVEYSEENVETVWASNYIGPVLLTELLLDSLQKTPQPRIIAVSSKGLLAKPFMKINFQDPEYRSRTFSMERNYYHSKLALMTWTVGMAQKLKDRNITVNGVRVPTVKVDLSRFGDLPPFLAKIYELKTQKALTPGQMAKTYVYLAASPEVAGITGKYFNEKNVSVGFPKKCLDPENIDRLAEMTASYLK